MRLHLEAAGRFSGPVAEELDLAREKPLQALVGEAMASAPTVSIPAARSLASDSGLDARQASDLERGENLSLPPGQDDDEASGLSVVARTLAATALVVATPREQVRLVAPRTCRLHRLGDVLEPP